jgi:hypothetical protein
MRSSFLARVVVASLGVSVVVTLGCGTTAPTPFETPTPTSTPTPTTTVTVEFGGRVVNADAGGAVGNVRVSLEAIGFFSGFNPAGWVFPKDTATSAGGGTFTLSLSLPSVWKMVYLRFTGPAGYDDTVRRFEPTASPCHIAPCWAVADRPEIRMYPTIVVSPGESIEVRVDRDIAECGGGALPACAGGSIAG